MRGRRRWRFGYGRVDFFYFFFNKFWGEFREEAEQMKMREGRRRKRGLGSSPQRRRRAALDGREEVWVVGEVG